MSVLLTINHPLVDFFGGWGGSVHVVVSVSTSSPVSSHELLLCSIMYFFLICIVYVCNWTCVDGCVRVYDVISHCQ